MLTPDDIAQRRFLITLRGYDRDEVTSFLQEVGDEVRGLRRRLAELEAQVARDADSTIPEGGDVRAALQVLGQETTRVLVAAEDSAREIESRAAVAAQEHRDQAAREAREAVEQANRQAARVIAEAERRRDAVADEIVALKQDRDRFLEGLRASMASIGGVVGGLSSDDEPAPVEDQPVAVEGDEPAPTPAPTPVGPADVTTELPVGTRQPAGDADVESSEPAPPSEPSEVAEPVPPAEPATPSEAEQAPDADEASEPDEPPSVTDELPRDEAEAEAAAEDDDGPPTVGERRDAALQDLRDDMGRQCKRGLQEIQNEVLASIRDRGRGASLDELLPTEAELDSLGDRASEHFAGAYERARADAAAELGAEAPDGQQDGDVRVKDAMARFRAVLGHEITSALRATLRAGLEAEEPSPQLSERVGEAFRDLRGPVVETAVEAHLQRTYAHGLVDAWRQLGVTQVQWQAVDEPRCPEGRCRTNAAEGAMAIGDEFPSGDAVPPAHQGCVCVVVPVVDDVA